MKSFLPFLLLLFFFPNVLSAHINFPEGGRSAAMGNASVALADFWSIHNNQAGLAFYNKTSAGFYFENRFLVKEMSLKAGGATLPVGSGVFGFELVRFGNELYNESKFGLAYSRKFGDYFAAGLQLDYLHKSLGNDYGKKGVATFEAGLMTKTKPDITLGMHVFNPIHTKLTKYADERIPAVMRIGAAWSFDKSIILSVEAKKETSFDPSLKLGLEYRIIDEVYVRGGLSSNPGQYTFGFGINLNRFTIDFASSVHNVLGFSPQFSAVYNFKTKR